MKDLLLVMVLYLLYLVAHRVSAANDAFDACAQGGGAITVGEWSGQTCTPARRGP